MRILPVALLFPFCLVGPASSAPAEFEVAVIAHESVSADTLSRLQLLDVFAGDVDRWSDGVRVMVKDLKVKGEVRDAFYEFLGKRPSRMKSIWLKRMLSGEGERPESLTSEEDMLASVAKTPGAIGFISKAKVTDSVKLLLLIPGDGAR